MSSLSKLHKIGAFAKLAKTNLRTLRYYEEVGLLRPAARSRGGFRYYRETDLNRIRLIHSLQELGLTLEEIGSSLENSREIENRKDKFSKIHAALGAHSELIASRLTLLEAQKAEIELARKKLEQCKHCESFPSLENNYCEPCEIDGQRLPNLLSGLF